jgi:signal transduction histidine kinase
MSIKSSFFILTIFAFVFFIGLELVNWKADRADVQVKSKVYSQKTVDTFEKVLALKADAFKKQALDYAAWNDLVNFMTSHDEQWAKDNLEGSIIQFGANGFFIVDQSHKVLFSEVDQPFLKPLSSLMDMSRLNGGITKLAHFFNQTPSGIVEFFVAPIHRIDTSVETTSDAKGFVVFAKVWDKTFLQELNGYGLGEVSLSLRSIQPHTLLHEIPLKGIDGLRVAEVYVYIHDLMGEVLDEYAMEDLKLSIVYLAALMVVMALLIAKFISLPLRDIMLSLKSHKKEPLKKYLLKENEYGAIATALCESFDAKEELEKLNLTLEDRVHEEVESGRLKDRVLFQQAKLAALGEMLTNIAHQWRQPLNTISVVISKLYLQNKSEKLTPQIIDEEIQKLRKLIQEMSTTIDDFKDFFQADKSRGVFYLYHCIEESLRISDGGISKGHIDVQVECPPSIVLNSFKKELSHVLLVLINNSKDALMARKVKHGFIHVRAFEQEHYVIIEVCDNAGGVTPEHLPHLFDPFFTTKKEGSASGVGLYMSKQIIEQSMRGSINATNEKDGLCVTIVLPKNDF